VGFCSVPVAGVPYLGRAVDRARVRVTETSCRLRTRSAQPSCQGIGALSSGMSNAPPERLDWDAREWACSVVTYWYAGAHVAEVVEV